MGLQHSHEGKCVVRPEKALGSLVTLCKNIVAEPAVGKGLLRPHILPSSCFQCKEEMIWTRLYFG